MADAAGAPADVEWSSTRPPFEPGNTLSLRHGLYSPRTRAAATREVLAEVEGELDGIQGLLGLQPVDRFALEAWAQAEGMVRQLEAHVEEHGMFTADGRRTDAVDLLRQWTGRAEKARAALGFDPLCRVRLLRDVAQTAATTADLEQIEAAGRAAHAAAGAEEAARTVDGERVDS